MKEVTDKELGPENNGKIIDEELVDDVLEQYEKRPYPAEDERVLSDKGWKLAPFGWWNGTGRLAEGAPGRLKVLVAGCGTGNEAFNLARVSKEFDVTAVDFSSRSIDVANRWLAASGLENLKFLHGDLTAEDFTSMLEGPFDLISCHGVISYIREAGNALANLEKLLADDGCLYLGCNGSTHVSRKYRPVLDDLDCDLNNFQPDSALRQKVALCDDLLGLAPGKGIASQSDGFIGSDIFGSVNRCQSLADWIALAESSGLTYLGALNPTRSLAQIRHTSSVNFLREQSLGWVHSSADRMKPCAFHRILFGKGGRKMPDFSAFKQEDLMKWMPLVNLWKRDSIPPIKKPFERKVSFKLNVPGLFKDHAIQARAFVLEFLRRCDGETTLEEITGALSGSLGADKAVPLLYRFYLCGMVNLRPPS